MNPVLKQLILKDVRLSLPLMVAMVVAGAIALAVMHAGSTGFAVGGILYITANIAGGIFIGMYCIVQERKEQSSLFTLSLPVSVAEVGTVKFASALLVFALPWAVLTLLLIAVQVFSASIPAGQLVYALMLQGSFLALVCVYFAVIAATPSDGVAGFSILSLNMGFSLFMVWVNQPPVQAPLKTDHIVWTTPAITSLTVEVLAIVLSIALGFFFLSRRRETQ